MERAAEPFRSGSTGAESRPVKTRSAKNAERLAAALRSGVLTGRVHTRKGPLSILRNVSLCLNRG